MKTEMDKTQKDTLAIVGIGCRIPGDVVDADSYWRLLKNSVDAVTEIPAGRLALWQRANIDAGSFPRHGGFLQDIDHFDPYFFNMSPRESEAMDSPNMQKPYALLKLLIFFEKISRLLTPHEMKHFLRASMCWSLLIWG